MPAPTSSNNKAVMDVAVELPAFMRFNLYQLNLVRIHLGIYYLSNLVRPNSSRVMDCYINGVLNRLSINKYSWLKVLLSVDAFQIWRKFIPLITFSN